MEDGESNEGDHHTDHGVEQEWASPGLLHQRHRDQGGDHVDETGQTHHPLHHRQLHPGVLVHEAGEGHHLQTDRQSHK